MNTTQKMLAALVAGFMTVILFAGGTNAAISFTLFGAPYPNTDAAIGVNRYVIEDFEDTTLIAGLQVELSGAALGNFGPVGTLPTPFFPFDPVADDPNAAKQFNEVWDGSHVLLNRNFAVPVGYTDSNYGDVTFSITGGTTSFGFAFGDVHLSPNAVSVNGNLLTNLPTGQGYLRIDATGPDVINTVLIDNASGDGLVFDHVAVVPEPSGLLLTGLAGAGLLFFRRRACGWSSE